MKTLVLTLALLAQTALVFAGGKKETEVIRPRTDNVKVYQQAGTSAPVLDSLQASEQVTLVRKYNALWSIVLVDGKPGYVLTSELVSEKAEAPVVSARK